MYYPSSENKGADQLRGYREADLHLCFRIGNNPVFSRCGSVMRTTRITQYMYESKTMFLALRHLLKLPIWSDVRSLNVNCANYLKHFPIVLIQAKQGSLTRQNMQLATSLGVIRKSAFGQSSIEQQLSTRPPYQLL